MEDGRETERGRERGRERQRERGRGRGSNFRSVRGLRCFEAGYGRDLLRECVLKMYTIVL